MQRKHVLILGPAGVGKSALVGQLREQLSLLVSARSAHLGAISEGLEPQLGLDPAGLKFLQRKQRLREAVLRPEGRLFLTGWAGFRPS